MMVRFISMLGSFAANGRRCGRSDTLPVLSPRSFYTKDVELSTRETGPMPDSRRRLHDRPDLVSAATAGVLALAALGALAAFWPVLRNGFVNWDDPTVLVDNPHLARPGVVSWAFSTTLIGHYQPLAWLVWSATKSWFGLAPAAFHALSLAVHIANGMLVYALTARLG